MRCLIHRITRKTGSGISHADHTVETHSLSIGRATDQDVFLADLHVALHHALIRPATEDGFSVQARAPSGVQINGTTVQAGFVKTGDAVTIGQSTLRVIRPPEGYDLALEVEETRAERGQPAGAGATSLQAAGLRRRPWAWLAFLLVAGLGLGVPLMQIHESEPPDIDMNRFQVAEDAGMPWRRLGGDHLWDSGPMSRAHRFFGQECRACHRQPFQRVTNEACVGCHADQPHHAEDAELLRVSGLAEQRCASCHVEHNGTEGLIAKESSLCTDCHANPGKRMPGSRIGAVTGFDAASHPEFRVRVVSRSDDADEGGPFDWHRIRMDQHLREDSGLVFPHDAHLEADGIESPDGKRVLECASCHRPDGGGDTMQPIQFERDCQSCHRLNFEPTEPARELPHGEPDAILATLRDYYARVALAGGYRNEAIDVPPVVRRDRPSRKALDRSGRRAALAWADHYAIEVAEEVIEIRTCATCHGVERRQAADDPPEWSIAPVTLTAEWYPKARFSHSPHKAMDCQACHDARPSQRSADVLMPQAETCRQCHGDADSQARVASRCIDCHGFHTGDEFTMGRRNGSSQ